MSSERKKTEQEYAVQLSDFENQLKYTLDDDSLQQEVFRAVRDLVIHPLWPDGRFGDEDFNLTPPAGGVATEAPATVSAPAGATRPARPART